MKNILLVLLCFGFVFSAKAQAPFSMAVSGDTVYATVNSAGAAPGATDFITNTSVPSGLTLKWHVSNTNFPTDWLTYTAFGVCDNSACFNNLGDTGIWNNTSRIGAMHTSAPYLYDSSMTFDLSLNLSGTSAGTHFVSVQVTDPTTPAYSRLITFVITNGTATGISPVTNPENNVVLYPNPARDELNVVYDASTDVKTIAVYNIIGKVMAVYKVNGPSANLNLENMPSGIYFVRLVNSYGQVVTTKKFTKQ